MAAFAKNLDLSWFDAISKTPEEAAFLKAQFERMNEGSE